MHWAFVVLGFVSALWAIQQFRMVLVYLGLIPSQWGIVGSPLLVRIAFVSALCASACAVIFFVGGWPQLITRIAIVTLAGQIIHFVLTLLGITEFKGYTAKGRIYVLGRSASYTIVLAVIAIVCSYYLGL